VRALGKNSLPEFDWSNVDVGDCGSLIVFSGGGPKNSTDGEETNLHVMNSSLSQEYKIATAHDGDDGLNGHVGDPASADYPDATPELLRLTGADRPLGTGSVVEQGLAFAPGSYQLAFVTNLTGADRTDSLYRIDAGACIGAVRSQTGISSACAVALMSTGINSRNVDWRPNWPNPIP